MAQSSSSGTSSSHKTLSTEYSTPTYIPKAADSPFIDHNSSHQGSLYMIILPAIGAIFVLYLLYILFIKLRAKWQAKRAPPFEDMYEPKITQSHIFDLEQAPTLVPTTTGVSFAKSTNTLLNQKSKETGEVSFFTSQERFDPEPAELIGLARSSMEIPRSTENKSINTGSVFQLQLNGTQSGISSSNENANGRASSTSGSTAYYSLAEPDKAATQKTVAIPNHKKHFHKKTLSSIILDEFISTGELPADEPNGSFVEDDTSKVDSNVQNHSMFESYNDTSYNADMLPSTGLRSSPIRRSRQRPMNADTSALLGNVSRNSTFYRQEAAEESMGSANNSAIFSYNQQKDKKADQYKYRDILTQNGKSVV